MDWRPPQYGTLEWSNYSENGAFPKIAAGSREQLKLTVKGIPTELEKTVLKPFLPFLGAKIVNESAQPIRVIIGTQERSGFSIRPKKAAVFDELPFSILSIQNIGTDEIKAGEIIVTCINDISGILKYSEAVTRGLIPSFNIR